ncbi:Inner membrane transport permease YbhS [bacterium HR16]|nr:Inner membrane transport permease YbhS [bacterium HR16]
MWTRIRAVMRKELIHIFRDARTLAVVIVLPVLMLILYGYAINLDVRHLRTAILDEDKTSASREFIRSLQHNEYFDVVQYLERPGQIDALFAYGGAKLVFVIPRGFGRDVASGKTPQVQALIDGSDSTTATIAQSYVSGFIQTVSIDYVRRYATRAGLPAERLAVPIDFQPRVWYNPEMKSTHFIVPGLIAVILMQISALLTSLTIVRERERGTIEQLVVSPVMPHELMIGKIVPYVIIAYVDVLLVLVSGRLLFGVPLKGSVVLLLVHSAVFLFASMGIGLLISVLARTQLVAFIAAMLGTMLPSVLLSGFMFPISAMPPALQYLTYLIPARYFIVILRGIFLKGVGPEVLWKPALSLIVFGLVAIVLSARRFQKRL